ncbi:hypothetical protein [Ornithinimicrobium avium]|uniref:SGNH hydrolase-type esterase domain-containing protein n=1 Tax=Ornithinimicrobium avium TaxID=2283195 RepID=A0A345NMW3_9MICO|nr:hypothetical protein [Ornithinimicrobium avium]AXH96371.1 hypothetical protein DV701_09790 [Ornithinimicrobium avium]
MEIPTKVQNLALVVLCVVAVGASGLAYWSVNRPHPASQNPSAAAPVAPGDSTAGPTGTADPAATTSEGPSATATEAPDGGSASVSEWVDAWSGDADLLVVGDGFSHLPTQWVQLWADRVGRDRPVTIHHWGETADVSFNDPIELSDGAGEPLDVWSASRDGSTIHDAAERYQRFVDASTEPDAVLVSMGLDSGEEDVADGLDELVGQVDEDVPVLIAIGPDDLYDEGVADALLSWAEEYDDRVAVLDLRGEAPDSASAEEWAMAFARALDRS